MPAELLLALAESEDALAESVGLEAESVEAEAEEVLPSCSWSPSLALAAVDDTDADDLEAGAEAEAL